jgi:hypothetical protein
MPDLVDRRSVLQRKACQDCRIVNERVEQRIRAIGIEKDFSNATVEVIAHGHFEPGAVALKGRGDRRPSVRETVARRGRGLVNGAGLAYFHGADPYVLIQKHERRLPGRRFSFQAASSRSIAARGMISLRPILTAVTVPLAAAA